MSTELYNEQQVSEILGLSLATLRQWRWLRTGPPYLKIGRAVRYRPEDLEAYLKGQLIDTHNN